jgi:hypothetical protein
MFRHTLSKWQIIHILFICEQGILGKTNRLLSFHTTRTAQKTTPTAILHCRRNVFTELLPRNMEGGIHKLTHRLPFDNTRTTSKITCPIMLLLLRVFLAEGRCCRCLVPNEGIKCTEPLRNNDCSDTQIIGRVFLSMPLRCAQLPCIHCV